MDKIFHNIQYICPNEYIFYGPNGTCEFVQYMKKFYENMFINKLDFKLISHNYYMFFFKHDFIKFVIKISYTSILEKIDSLIKFRKMFS